MNTKQAKIIRFIIFLTIGAAIVWWLYRDQDLSELVSTVRYDVNYWWIIASLFAGLMSHVSRTIRWQMMITPLSGRPRFINTFLSVMIGYLANLVVPRMGEVTRCAVLSKHEKMSFSQLFGTVVAERIVDVLSMLLSLALVFMLQFNVLTSIAGDSFDFSRLYASLTTPLPFVILAVAGLTLWLLRKKIKSSSLYIKVKGFISKFKEGFLSIRDIENKTGFVLHSILIFALYFAMMYFNFFAFNYTSHLSPLAGLTVFVFGALAMVAPVQGGIGPWHFMVITALIAYGINSGNAGIFALVVHGALNIMIIVLGLLSLVALPLANRQKK